MWVFSFRFIGVFWKLVEVLVDLKLKDRALRKVGSIMVFLLWYLVNVSFFSNFVCFFKLFNKCKVLCKNR